MSRTFRKNMKMSWRHAELDYKLCRVCSFKTNDYMSRNCAHCNCSSFEVLFRYPDVGRDGRYSDCIKKTVKYLAKRSRRSSLKQDLYRCIHDMSYEYIDTDNSKNIYSYLD